jgi:hypothetical protein
MRRLLRHPAMPGALIGLVALLVASGIPADAASTVSRTLFASRAKVATTARNANRVDGLSASRTPVAGRLLALNADGQLPTSVLPGGGAGARGPARARGAEGPASLTQAPGLTESRTFTLRAGNQDTALSCTVRGRNSVCTGTTSAEIPPHTLISIGQTATGNPPLTDVRFGWRATS